MVIALAACMVVMTLAVTLSGSISVCGFPRTVRWSEERKKVMATDNDAKASLQNWLEYRIWWC
jgi:hypothetical protein